MPNLLNMIENIEHVKIAENLSVEQCRSCN